DKRTTDRLKNKAENEAMIDYSNISEFIYNSLISLENINKFYENDDVELAIDFDIELSSIIDIILNEDNKNLIEDKKLYLEVAQCIIKFIEEGDGYSKTSRTIKIEVFSSLNLVKVKCSYLMLHLRPIHVVTSSEICEFIRNNINYLVPELYHQIKEKQLDGHENFTIQQTYYWWSKKSQRIYQRSSDPLVSAKL
ncbi:29225_t:CDS:2, partial [Gigaspora margarita]